MQLPEAEIASRDFLLIQDLRALPLSVPGNSNPPADPGRLKAKVPLSVSAFPAPWDTDTLNEQVKSSRFMNTKQGFEYKQKQGLFPSPC